MDLKESRTYKNLLATFASECRSRTIYDLYGEKADAETLVYVGDVFRTIAEQEYAHAREIYDRFLGKISNTEGNLKKSQTGEMKEGDSLYKQYEDIARSEGFNDVADFYKYLQEVERVHSQEFKTLDDKLSTDSLYNSDEVSLWQCTNCGYIYEGTNVPERCPLCYFPKGYFAPYCKGNTKDREE